jgi:hypothetical protein
MTHLATSLGHVRVLADDGLSAHNIIVGDDLFVGSTSSATASLDDPTTPSAVATTVDKPSGAHTRGRGWKGKGRTMPRDITNGQ